MLAPTLKDYLLMIEATNKSYALMERSYGFIAEALEKLDVASDSKVLSAMRMIASQSAHSIQAWNAVLASIDLEVRTAESIRLLLEKVLGIDSLKSVLRLTDYTCWVHDHQNSTAFLKGQQLKLKEGMLWIAQQSFQAFEEPQRQLVTFIQSSIDSIDTLLAANRKLEAMVQASMEGILDRDGSDEQGFQNLIQHCQRWSSPPPQEGLVEVQAVFMALVLARLKMQPLQDAVQRGESHV